eukprot:2963760-Rhodomonas_salina.1
MDAEAAGEVFDPEKAGPRHVIPSRSAPSCAFVCVPFGTVMSCHAVSFCTVVRVCDPLCFSVVTP